MCYTSDRASVIYRVVRPLQECARLSYGNVLGIQGHEPRILYPYAFVAGPNKHEYLRRFVGVAGTNSNTTSKTFDYRRTYKTLDNGLGTFSFDIYAYDGESDTDWAQDELGNLLPKFRRVCTVAADLSCLQSFLKVQKSSEGQEFWKVFFKVKVLFGGTALKARLAWYEGVSISHFHPRSLIFGCVIR